MKPAADAAARSAFYARFPDFWADVDGREYALYDALTVSRDQIAALRRCAADVALVMARVAPLVRALDDASLVDLGYHPRTLDLVRSDLAAGTPALARVDCIGRSDGRFAAIEINADTPAFVVESHRINGALCAQFGLDDPNAGQEAALRATLQRAVARGIAALRRPTANPPYVAFTSATLPNEDRETTRYQRELVASLGAYDTAFVPLADLRIDAGGLYDAAGRRIDVLYRHWPIEFFADDRDALSGTFVGSALFALVQSGGVALVNPPCGYVWQNKALFALAWGLYERGAILDAAERAAVERSFLPTALDPLPPPYVAKPALGREGASVDIVRDDGALSAVRRHFDGGVRVYQRFEPLPERRARTRDGVETLRALHTCFLLDGVPGAVGVRLGGEITDNDAYFAALGSREEPEV